METGDQNTESVQGAVGGEDDPEMNEAKSRGTFQLVFVADKFHVLRDEFKAWSRSLGPGINLSISKPDDDGDITVTIEGKESELYKKAEELIALSDSVEAETEQFGKEVIQILKQRRHRDHVQAALVSHGILTVLRLEGEGQGEGLSITCLQEKRPAAKKCIEDLFPRQTIVLTRPNQEFLANKKSMWVQQKTTLEQNGDVKIQQTATAITITGFKEAVKEAYDIIKESLKGNSISIETLDVVDAAKFKLIKKHYRSKLDQMVKDFNHRIHIMLEDADSAGAMNKIKFKGELESDTKQAKAKVRDLVASIAHKTIPCKKPGMAHYLTNPGSDGPEVIQGFEEMKHCIIQINAATKPASENVKVIKGDLTKQKADVIVVPIATAKDDLSECGLVAKVVGVAAGSNVKDDFKENHKGLGMGGVAVTTVTGKLSKCSHIMYVGIRTWRGFSTRKLLAKGINDILAEMKRLDLGSVVFPTIGCGQAGYPACDVAQVITEAAKANKAIQVSIVVYDDDLYHDFSSAVRTTTKKRATSGSEVKVSVGDITKTKADVLVCPVVSDNPDVYNNCGVLAKVVSGAAGRNFSREYTSKGGLKDGATRMQDPHDLKCKKVCLISIRQWKSGNKEVLEKAIEACLSKAHGAGCKSVVFPTLGCGGLGYRANVIAQIMKDVMHKYSDKMQLEIMAFKDDDVYKHFQEVFAEEEPMVALEAETLRLGVYAKDASTVQAVTRDLNKLIDKHYQEMRIPFVIQGPPYNFLRRLRNELARLQNELVFLEIDKDKKEIHVQGEKGAAIEATSNVYKVIHTMEKEMKPTTPTKTQKVVECPYFKLCLEFLKTLKIPGGYFDREFNLCFCDKCHKNRGDANYGTRGRPAERYSVPLGWCKFALRLPARAGPVKAPTVWHRTFHGTKVESIIKILEVGDLVPAGRPVIGGSKVSVRPGHITPGAVPGFDVHQVFVSPSSIYAGMYATEKSFTASDGKVHSGKVAFQVLIMPGTYNVGPQTVGAKAELDPHISNSKLEWSTNQHGSTILSGLLLKVT